MERESISAAADKVGSFCSVGGAMRQRKGTSPNQKED